jgi:nucleotide-binding universal stress UspA family protein
VFKTVLVPVDLTDKNRRAIEVACELATPGGTVTTFHVIETIDAPFEELQDFYKRLEDQAREHMNAMCAPFRSRDVTLQELVVYGRRAPQIVQHAQTNPVDLIVITSHRMDPDHPEHGFMSISHQIALVAPGPVLVLR